MSKNVTYNRKVRLEITDSEPEAFIYELTVNHIPLEDIVFTGFLTVQFTTLSKNCKSVFALADARGVAYRKLESFGLFQGFLMFFNRPVLLTGGIILLCLMLFLPGRILRIEVVGNQRIPSRYILRCAEISGIKFGSKATTVRSEAIKNQMLELITDLQWVGVNTKGCVATIRVKEREPELTNDDPDGIAGVYASRDGIISQITVRNGKALCAPGESVLQGDLLISGYSDLGQSVSVSAADGEVYAFTRREFMTVSPLPMAEKGRVKKKHTCFRLRIGKKVINFCNHSGIPDATCDKMYTEYYGTLPGGFLLPVSAWKIVYQYYELQPVMESERSAPWLEADTEVYLRDQMVAGQFLSLMKTRQDTAQLSRLSGVYFCREMIGRVRYEEIFENHAENN